MSKELWQQAKQALAEALALESDQRVTFLDELENKSPELRVEVESLLASQEAAEDDNFLKETVGFFSTKTFDPVPARDFDPDQTSEFFPKGATDESTTDFGEESGIVGRGYELIKEIGRGGMGVVYKAYHRGLRRTVAVKIIMGSNLSSPKDIARFHVEAEAAARLDHPGIVPVYDVGEHCGNHYYAMAYVEGPNLSNYVGSNAKRLPPRRAAKIMEQVCHAVQYAHDRAVIHRDLKPANIILEHGDHPRLADFGLAKVMQEDEGLTITGQVMGTPSYMAPEQATGRQDQMSNRTDVYSLGATLYALLAGRPPFVAETLLETIRMVVNTDPEPIEEGVPPDLQTICEKCLTKLPNDRYESADDLADDLRRYLDGFPITARPAGPWLRTVRWCRRNPLVATLLGVTTFALLAGTAVSVGFGIEAGKQAVAAQSALHEAEVNAQRLRKAIQEAFVFASEDVLSQEPGMQKAREVLLQTAQRYSAELVRLTPRDSASLRASADAQFMLGKIQMALGKNQVAHASLRAAKQIQERIIEKDPRAVDTLTALAKTHNELARLCELSWRSFTKLQAVSQLPAEDANLARERLRTWQIEAAEAVKLREYVVQRQPYHVESQRLLASATMNQGIAAGEQAFAKQLLEEHDQARRTMLRGQDIRRRILAEHPYEQDVRRDLARGYVNLANSELRAADQERENTAHQQRLLRAVTDATEAITAYQQLLTDPPAAELDTKLELASCYRLRADAHFKQRNQDTAEKDYRHALRLAGSLVMRNPNVYRYRMPLAETQYNLCNLLFLQKKQSQATQLLANCRATLLQAIRIDPNNDNAGNELVRFTSTLVQALAEQGNFALAGEQLDSAIGELQTLQKESSEFSGLQTHVETLKKTAAVIREQRKQAEKPAGVI